MVLTRCECFLTRDAPVQSNVTPRQVHDAPHVPSSREKAQRERARTATVARYPSSPGPRLPSPRRQLRRRPGSARPRLWLRNFALQGAVSKCSDFIRAVVSWQIDLTLKANVHFHIVHAAERSYNSSL